MKKLQFALIGTVILIFTLPLLALASDHDLEWTGRITTVGGQTGTWVIGGLTVQATTATRFEREHNNLAVGDCAEVEYYLSGGNKIAVEIDSEEDYKCSGGSDDDDDGDGATLKRYAVVNSFPAGLQGNWTIGGTVYTADANTQFEQDEHGSFTVGGCVELKYISGSNRLVEIETESSYKCTNSDDDVDPDTDYNQRYGLITVPFPPDLIGGSWTISNTVYTVTTQTRFEQEDGPFFVGGCVEVKYTGVNQAVEISTESAYKCSGHSGNEDPLTKFYAIAETIGNPLQGGLWQVGGVTFSSTLTTKLERKYGDFAVGKCTEVEYYQDNAGNNVALEFETEAPYHCNNSATNQIYGRVTGFPAGLYGVWIIDGNNSYNAGGGTKFEQENGSFVLNGCVQIEYYTKNGVNQIIEIETEESSDCDGGAELPGDSKLYAAIDPGGFPGGNPPLGTWSIGGESYQATVATTFEEEHGAFGDNVCVKAKYVENSGVKTLLEVETKESYKCQNGDGKPEYKAYGVIEALPVGFSATLTSTWQGDWQISGVTYSAVSTTTFEQEHGFWAVGAYVEVEYIVVGGNKIATSLETHVASGAGTTTQAANLDSMPADEWDDWIIGGQTYQADPVLEVESITNLLGTGRLSASLVPVEGEPVIFNTYRSNGQAYLTAITGATVTYLPVIMK